MFERYTENARRIIFFSRYESSQFGSPFIESEHLLLGLLREDQALINRLVSSHVATESIRKRIEEHTPPGEKTSTSVDLPLSHECKRVLGYGAEEANRLEDEHIGAEHLLLGLLREEQCFAAQLLREQGVTLESARQKAPRRERPFAQGGSAFLAGLDRWLAEREALGEVGAVKRRRLPNGTIRVVIYAADPPKESAIGQDMAPAEELAQMRRRVELLLDRLERAIVNHEFEKARVYSEEERKERENMRLLRGQFNLEEPAPRVPLLCIEVIRNEGLSEVQRRCDDSITEGIAQVWLLDPDSKRAYTVTKAEGLREVQGTILQIANPPLEMDLRTIFD